MNKLEARVLLFIITFFAAIQYAFIQDVDESMSKFAFLCITDLIGFLIMAFMLLGMLIKDFYRISLKQVIQALVLSCEITGFNFFMVIGTSGAGATVSSCVLSSYFVFVPIIELIFKKKKIQGNVAGGIVIALSGLLVIMGFNFSGMLDWHVLSLVIADICFAAYILTTGEFSKRSNPSFLVVGQLFFNFLLTLFLWTGESLIGGKSMIIESNPQFWANVIFVSVFIRGLYSIVQLYAQRFISPLDTSLIFSTEIIMTMLMSPVLGYVFGTAVEEITIQKLTGGVVMIAGILLADEAVFSALKKRIKGVRHEEKKIL